MCHSPNWIKLAHTLGWLSIYILWHLTKSSRVPKTLPKYWKVHICTSAQQNANCNIDGYWDFNFQFHSINVLVASNYIKQNQFSIFLRYESSTPTSKELRSSISQSLSVSQWVRASVSPDQISTLFNILRHKCPPALYLVFGAYGEASDGVKKLLHQIVESRVFSHARQCEVLVGEAVGCWRGSRSSWEEERVGKTKRGRECQAWEESPLAWKDYWQKPFLERRFSTIDFYFELFKFCLMFNFATLTQ